MAPRLECDTCGSRPRRFDLLTDEHEAGDSCPCGGLADYDCDGTLVEIPDEIPDEPRTVHAWLLYDWETRTGRWSDWHDEIRPAADEKLYFVEIELDPRAQFLAEPKAYETAVRRVAYKDPCVPAPADPQKFFQNLPGYVASLVHHVVPPCLYGPSLGPMTTRYADDHVYVDLPDGTHVDISVKVTKT